MAESMKISTTDDEKAIRGLVDEWLKASARGDHQKILGLMTEDVVFMVPDQEPFGREAFQEISKQMDDVSMEAKKEIQEIQVLGDWAYLRVYLELTMTPKDGGPPARRSGYTLTILRKGSDKKWRIARDANLVTPDG